MIVQASSEIHPNGTLRAFQALAVTTAILAGFAAARASTQVYALVFVAALFLLYATRLRHENLLVAFVWITGLVHFFKRAIFLLGPQSNGAYYAVLSVPVLMECLLLILALHRIRARRPTASTLLLGAFFVWALLPTLMPFSDTPLETRLLAVVGRFLPMALFVVGLTVPLGSALFRRVARALLYAAALSVAYGLMIHLFGPTPVERVWAEQREPYSYPARHLLSFLYGTGGTGVWRSFSYLADYGTWGFFLTAAFVACMADWSAKDRPVRWPAKLGLAVMILTGLFLTFTRTPFLGFLAILGCFALLGLRAARRPWVLFGIFIAGFFLVEILGTYVYSRYYTGFPSDRSDDPIARRYLSVGTIQARLGAGDAVIQGLRAHPVVGIGYAVNRELWNDRLLLASDPTHHNFVAQTVLLTGGIGLLLFLGFLFAILREGLQTLKQSGNSGSARWLVALVTGSVATGYVSGSGFMASPFFFLLAGSLAAGFTDSSEAAEELG